MGPDFRGDVNPSPVLGRGWSAIGGPGEGFFKTANVKQSPLTGAATSSRLALSLGRERDGQVPADWGSPLDVQGARIAARAGAGMLGPFG